MNEKSGKLKPLVSICIPTYNAAFYIEETLRSITKQTYSNIEIIIGDNASEDNTEQLIHKFKETCDSNISYYKNPENLGYSGNCNKMINLSNGEFIAIYHSDDIYDPSIVAQQVEILLNNKDIAGCFTSFSMIDEKGLAHKKYPVRLPNWQSKNETIYNYDKLINKLIDHYKNPFFCPSSMIRKEAYLSIGGYNEKLKYIEDQDMWLRLLESNCLAIINKKLVQYRIHDKQGSSVYRDTTRKIENPMIEHLRNHLLTKHGCSEYSAKYKVKIDRLLAIEDIRFAFLRLKINASLTNYSEYKGFIDKSKSKYLFKFSEVSFLRYSIFQWLPSKLTYLLLNLRRKIIK